MRRSTVAIALCLMSSPSVGIVKSTYDFDLGNGRGSASISVDPEDLKGKNLGDADRPIVKIVDINLTFTHQGTVKTIPVSIFLNPEAFGIQFIDATGDGYTDFLVPEDKGWGPFYSYQLFIYSDEDATFHRDDSLPFGDADISLSQRPGCVMMEAREGHAPYFEYVKREYCYDRTTRMFQQKKD